MNDDISLILFPPQNAIERKATASNFPGYGQANTPYLIHTYTHLRYSLDLLVDHTPRRYIVLNFQPKYIAQLPSAPPSTQN